MNSIKSKVYFLNLLQLTLGRKADAVDNLSEENWREVFQLAQDQAIEAFLIESLEKLNLNGIKPPAAILLEWIGISEQVRHQNSIINRRCADLAKHFEEAGFKSCILKGQGNAQMYPNPERRSPGDIDIWVDASKKVIVDYIHSIYPEANVAQHHVDFPLFDDVNIEVHYLSTYSVSLRHQKRLDAYIEENRDRQFNHSISLPDCNAPINVPTNDFNIIHQLTHMERHFFYGGIGLRQIVDFYYLIKKCRDDGDCRFEEIKKTIRQLGLEKYAKAVMWILRDALGMEEEYLILDTDEKRGKLVLEEIMKSGNFGNYDHRIAAKLRGKSKTLSAFMRNMAMFRQFPEESVSAPVVGLARRFFYK